MTHLADHIAASPVVDSHEHLRTEEMWINQGPRDVLHDLMFNYIPGDLISAGLDSDVNAELIAEASAEQRWQNYEPLWQSIQHTGYGEAVRMTAKHVYNIDEISLYACIAAQPKLDAMRQPGERHRILHDVAKIEHVQIDDICFSCAPDPAGVDFFLRDLSWAAFTRGFTQRTFDLQTVNNEVGITIKDIATLRQAMEAIFAKHGATAIAVKSQHAYAHTLRWEPRTVADAGRALKAYLADPAGVDDATCLCIEDWALARGVELAITYNLPFKIHCGYYAGNGYMHTDRINAGNLCKLLIAYPQARFVLMHAAYPYGEELIAIAKHFPNVYVDLCWAWSINPRFTADFLRSYIHAAPINKLFAFGGDTTWPTTAYAYSLQMRRWLTRAMQAEVDDGDLTERQAMTIVDSIFRGNQYNCFDIEGTRAALHSA